MVFDSVCWQALLAAHENENDFSKYITGREKGFMTRERHQELRNLWKERQRAKGMCHDCWKRKAGEDEGTRTLCGTCRRTKQAREERRRRAKGMKPLKEWIASVQKPKAIKVKRVPLGAKVASELSRSRKHPEDLKFKRQPPKRETSGSIERLFALASKQRPQYSL